MGKTERKDGYWERKIAELKFDIWKEEIEQMSLCELVAYSSNQIGPRIPEYKPKRKGKS